MKFAAVILLACVAVSSAAFTANLVQHTQPAVSQAMFTIRLATGNKAIAIPAVNSILDNLQSITNSILQQAGQIITQGQALGQSLVSQLQNAAQQLGAITQQTATQVQQVWQNIVSGFLQTFSGNKGLFSNAIAAVQNAIQSAYTLAQQLINQIDFSNLASQAINAVLPQNVAQLVIAQLGLNNKGIIGDLFGNLWGQITDVASQVASQIAQVVSQVTSIGQSAFAEVQAQASQFLANVAAGASHLSGQAAQQILAHISDLQEALGDQYQAVVDALNVIVINGKQF